MDASTPLVAGEDHPTLASRRLRRNWYRHPITSLSYVRLENGNGGILRNVSESGVAIQTVGPLQHNQLIHLRLELPKPKLQIDAVGQVVWTDRSGQAGLRFVDLPRRSHAQLKNWLFTNVLGVASDLSLNNTPVFGKTVDEERADGLIVSSAALPSISFGKTAQGQMATVLSSFDPIDDASIKFSWWPLDVRARTFMRLVDSVVVVSAVLLFAVIAIEIVGEFPSWIPALGLGLGLSSVFGLVYFYSFRFFAGATLGRHLARIASKKAKLRKYQEDLPRFR